VQAYWSLKAEAVISLQQTRELVKRRDEDEMSRARDRVAAAGRSGVARPSNPILPTRPAPTNQIAGNGQRDVIAPAAIMVKRYGHVSVIGDGQIHSAYCHHEPRPSVGPVPDE